MSVTLKQAASYVANCLKAGLVPYVEGSPGIGKSDMVKQVANIMNCKVIDHRLSTSDPTDLSGLPSVVDGKAQFTPFDLFPIEGSDLPKDEKGNEMNGWVLFLDELPSAPMAVQAAAYKLALDKEVGQYKLHPNVHIVCAGNKRTDGAIVNRMGTAMQSRLVHFEVDLHHEDWLQWAYSADIDPRITAYIGFAPNKLHMFDPNHQDKTFPCPRTWDFLSRYGKANDLTPAHMAAIEGTIGKGPAREFLQFCEVGKDLPEFSTILKDPKTTPVPEEPSTLYFLCGTLASKSDDKNIDVLMSYIERLNIEFQIICLRDMLQRQPELNDVPALKKWIKVNAKHLFAKD